MTPNKYESCDKMSATVDKHFSDWLLYEMNKRGWRQSDLARAARLNRQVISSYINRRREKPDEDILIAIAKAFGYPPETVFRAAGLLPPVPPMDGLKERILHLFDQLPPEQQEQLADFADFLVQQNETSRSTRPKPGTAK